MTQSHPRVQYYRLLLTLGYTVEAYRMPPIHYGFPALRVSALMVCGGGEVQPSCIWLAYVHEENNQEST